MLHIWATTWQNQQSECAPSEDSDQPGHPPSLIRVFAVCMKKPLALSYPMSSQRKLWSDWADAQADPSLRWAHSHFVGFDMSRLISLVGRNTGIHWLLIEPCHEKTCLCDQNKLKPACSADETSQGLEISAIASRVIILSRQRKTKVLIRLHGCAGWSAPLLFAYGINRFSHKVAQFYMTKRWWMGQWVKFLMLLWF